MDVQCDLVISAVIEMSHDCHDVIKRKKVEYDNYLINFPNFFQPYRTALNMSTTAPALVILAVIGMTHGFMCYTGDADVLRRKDCPKFSDVCFKKIPGRK